MRRLHDLRFVHEQWKSGRIKLSKDEREHLLSEAQGALRDAEAGLVKTPWLLSLFLVVALLLAIGVSGFFMLGFDGLSGVAAYVINGLASLFGLGLAVVLVGLLAKVEPLYGKWHLRRAKRLAASIL